MSLHRSAFLLNLTKVCKLFCQNTLHRVFVLVGIVGNVDCSAARADPVGADRTGVPSREPRDVRPLLAGGLGAALYEAGDVLGDVEQHHVVTWRERCR